MHSVGNRFATIAGKRMMMMVWLICVVVVTSSVADVPGQSTKLEFWKQQRKGANSQNRTVEPEYWNAAAAAGLEYIRLLPDAWPSESRDFLIGNADDFKQLSKPDLATLKAALDDAEREGVKVIMTMISLPGARWRQLNDDVDDGRLWQEPGFQSQAIEFWRQLARELKDHPAIVAYNPLNEPHSERAFGFEQEADPGFAAWVEQVKGTRADLNLFNQRMVKAIREEDSETPILLDGWFYASPKAISYVEPVDDEATLYAFHNYGPWIFTAYRVNKGRFAYPHRMPGASEGQTEVWSVENIRDGLSQVAAWADRHDIPVHHIIASEFWVDRRLEGAQQYLTDYITVLNERGWHWAFYAYRGDGAWGGLDYELGTGKQDWRIWGAEERGEDVEQYKKRGDNPLWQVISREFDKKQQ